MQVRIPSALRVGLGLPATGRLTGDQVVAAVKARRAAQAATAVASAQAIGASAEDQLYLSVWPEGITQPAALSPEDEAAYLAVYPEGDSPADRTDDEDTLYRELWPES